MKFVPAAPKILVPWEDWQRTVHSQLSFSSGTDKTEEHASVSLQSHLAVLGCPRLRLGVHEIQRSHRLLDRSGCSADFVFDKHLQRHEQSNSAYAHRVVQIEPLPLCWHICQVQVVAPHLVFVLHEHLPVCYGVRVPNVLEMGHALQPPGRQRLSRDDTSKTLQRGCAECVVKSHNVIGRSFQQTGYATKS